MSKWSKRGVYVVILSTIETQNGVKLSQFRPKSHLSSSTCRSKSLSQSSDAGAAP